MKTREQLAQQYFNNVAIVLFNRLYQIANITYGYPDRNSALNKLISKRLNRLNHWKQKLNLIDKDSKLLKKLNQKKSRLEDLYVYESDMMKKQQRRIKTVQSNLAIVNLKIANILDGQQRLQEYRLKQSNGGM